MDVVVTLEHRFFRTPDGATWTETQFPNAFWQRYLHVFDGVRIVARAQPVAEALSHWNRVDGPKVAFHALPYYQGPWQYLKKAKAVRRAVAEAAGTEHAIIMRVHSPIAALVERRMRGENKPYGVEVVSDPWDVFAPGAFHHPLRWYFRRSLSAQTKRQCHNAVAASYVTQHALQRRYPATNASFQTHYSSVELPPESFVEAPREFDPQNGPLKLITVGALAQMYKGVDTLIDAVAMARQQGADVALTIVGDGKHRGELEEQACRVNCADVIHFAGSLTSGPPVRAELDQADLFILASRQEGLPRAMIEAMARALPCVGTTVGGIPELLAEENLFAPNDAEALARRIGELASDRSQLNAMSQRNLPLAQQYADQVLRERRDQYYNAVRQATQQWLDGSSARNPVTAADGRPPTGSRMVTHSLATNGVSMQANDTVSPVAESAQSAATSTWQGAKSCTP
ncbi:glycosyltransferase [Bremerella cremea]|uniref:glycosyltransferase n=1 Tax=Bremerella cremea TaxID=1031537 RepID=UPI0031EF3B88